jgi:hypothetical protein
MEFSFLSSEGSLTLMEAGSDEIENEGGCLQSTRISRIRRLELVNVYLLPVLTNSTKRLVPSPPVFITGRSSHKVSTDWVVRRVEQCRRTRIFRQRISEYIKSLV